MNVKKTKSSKKIVLKITMSMTGTACQQTVQRNWNVCLVLTILTSVWGESSVLILHTHQTRLSHAGYRILRSPTLNLVMYQGISEINRSSKNVNTFTNTMHVPD